MEIKIREPSAWGTWTVINNAVIKHRPNNKESMFWQVCFLNIYKYLLNHSPHNTSLFFLSFCKVLLNTCKMKVSSYLFFAFFFKFKQRQSYVWKGAYYFCLKRIFIIILRKILTTFFIKSNTSKKICLLNVSPTAITFHIYVYIYIYIYREFILSAS